MLCDFNQRRNMIKVNADAGSLYRPLAADSISDNVIMKATPSPAIRFQYQ
jgi:hypothetical protein